MKKEHEQRISTLTAIKPDRRTHILLYGANIGSQVSPLNFEQARAAVVPDRYPTSEHPIELGLRNSEGAERDPSFWAAETRQLEQAYAGRVRTLLQSDMAQHLSVFALAPQPLLMLLGSLLTDKTAVDVYQRQREPEGWAWSADPSPANPFSVQRPPKTKGAPCLILGVSATVDRRRVLEVMGAGACVWMLTCQSPHNDAMKSRAQLSQFRSRAREVLADIRAAHGDQKVVHVFPAVPVSCAVEFGRILMPKADPVMRIYDHHRDGGFVRTVDINTVAGGSAEGGVS
jgi:hypothetical protein